MTGPRPQQPAPALELALAGGGRWALSDQQLGRFTLIAFYRGLHCPQCHQQLHELGSRLDELAQAGVGSVVAVSGDVQDRAETAVAEWDLGALPVGYGLTAGQMREWGLYVSAGVKEPEPALFNEPALYLIRSDGSVYSAHIQSTPFARPHLDNLIHALEFINEQDYPARGEA